MASGINAPKITLEVKINFKFKKGVGMTIKSKETSS